MKSLNKILLNLDATIESQHALDAAIFLAKSCSATIIAVNIVNKNVVTNLARFSDKSIAEIEVELGTYRHYPGIRLPGTIFD